MLPLPPIPLDEEERLHALRRFRILDTEPEPQFERIVNMAKRRFDVPMAFISFVDHAREFLKAPCESPLRNVPREYSFCAYTILDDEVLVVPDATEANALWKTHSSLATSISVSMPEHR